MNKKIWIVLYVAVLVADLIGVYINNETLRYIAKPLLMPLLIGYFIFSTKNFPSALKKWVILALVFSWAGDVLLMFESMNSSFFIFGLVAFLIAHLFYILFYEFIIRLENLKRRYWLFIPVLIYYVALIDILGSHLGEMELPVRIYGAIISYMLVQALQVGRIKNKKAAWMMIAGAVLFIGSDSILAFNKFYSPFEYAGVAIMLTYGLAQSLIVSGAQRSIISGSGQ